MPSDETASSLNAATNPPESQPSSERPPDQPSSSDRAGSEAAPESADFRFSSSAEIPEFARGKTANEVLDLASSFYKAALATPASAAPSAPNAAPSQPPAAPTPQTPVTRMSDQNAVPTPPDPQLMYTNPAQYQQELLNYNQAILAAQAAPLYYQNAQTARTLASQNPKRSDIWNKYASEIDAQMQNVDPRFQTQQAWELAADIVAGRHLDEIAAERASALAARPDTGTISGSDVPGSATPQAAGDAIAQLFASDSPAIQKFKTIGKSADDVRRHAAGMGHTPDAYAAMLTRNATVTTYETRDGQTTLVPTPSN